MEFIILISVLVLLVFTIYLVMRNLKLQVTHLKSSEQLKDLQNEVINLQDELGEEREKNRTLVSQKKSSETRLGNIGENLVPFLNNCPYDPRDLHFLGNPIDFVCFDFDQGEITFIEVKTGNSKTSKRQKIIKNIIKSGKVYFAEIRINEKGVVHKKATNIEEAETEEVSGESDGKN